MKKYLKRFNYFWWLILLATTATFASFFWLGFKIVPQIQIDSDLYLRLADKVGKFQFPDITHRTPLVPLFIAFFKLFGGLKGVVITQILLGSMTIYLIYKIIKKITKNQKLAGLTAVALAFDPLIISHQSAIMSETLGLFLLMLFLWLHLQLFNRLTKKRMIMTILGDFLLIMSRSVYIVLPIGMYIYHLVSIWWLKIKKIRPHRKLIVVAISVNFLFLISYQAINYFRHGFFGVTVISQLNLLGKVVQYGYLDNFKIETVTPEDVRKVVLAYQKSPEEKSPYTLLNQSHSEIHSSQILMSTLQPINKYFIARQKVDYIKKTINLIPHIVKTDRYYYDSINLDKFKLIKSSIDNIFNKINDWKLIALAIWLIVFAKWYLIEKRIIGYQVGVLLIVIIYTVVVISWFSHSDYIRLRMPIEPLLNMMIFLPVIYWCLNILKNGKS